MINRYTTIHRVPRGPGDSRPVAQQVIQDENLQERWSDKSILITGCSAGIGAETTRALFSTGATLFLTARNVCKARRVLGEIVRSSRVHLLELDLESLESVRSCANELKTKTNKLNILICNAGISVSGKSKTREGFEMQFGVNHLAHFLLFQLAKPLLSAATKPGFQSRVVMVSSIAHRFFNFDLENDIHSDDFFGIRAYAASKTANIWTANEIERRFGPEGIHAWSVQPGAVLTELTRDLTEEERQTQITNPLMRDIFKTAAQGASTVVWGAVAAVLEGQGGGYLEDCQVSHEYEAANGSTSNGYGAQAMNQPMAEEMWEKSLAWVGLS